jgi:hypothetical protein
MKTVKWALEIKVEVLDTQAAPKLLHQMIHQLIQGVPVGKLETECGDRVEWSADQIKVEF